MDIDEETAERYAVVTDYLRRAGSPIPTNDLWIAASAMQHGLKVLTADALPDDPCQWRWLTLQQMMWLYSVIPPTAGIQAP